MRILRDGGPLPRELVTRKSLENAAAAVAATGGSTNAGLHLPAIAHEAGIRFTLDDVAEVFRRTPLVADLQPGGRYLARDLHHAGGVSAVLKVLLDGGYLHGECLTLSGRTLKEALAGAPGADGKVVRPASTPIHPTRRGGGAQGQPLPRRGADQDRRAEVARVRGLRARVRVRGGRGRGGQGAPLPGGRSDRDPQRRAGRGPGMREMLGITALLYGQGMGEQVALLTEDGSRARRAACASATRARRPRPAGRSRCVRDGDRIGIDADTGRIELLVDEAEIARRRAGWQPRREERLAGVLEKYAKLVGPANLGAVTHSGQPRVALRIGH